MKKISLKKLFQLGLVSNFSVVRVNESGYPYVTMLQGDKSNNVYFGKESAKTALLHVGKKEIASLLVTADIVEVANEDGEQRFKIALEGKSDYVSTSELASLFGVEESTGDFNTASFVAVFASRDSQPNNNRGNVAEINVEQQIENLEAKLALETSKPKKTALRKQIAELEATLA